ncbi:MAG: hypothetical protein WD075_05685 [Rhodospirillales bacterium]
MGGFFKFDGYELLATLRTIGTFAGQNWTQFSIFIFIFSGLASGIQFALLKTGDDTGMIGTVMGFAVNAIAVPFMTAFHRTILAPHQFNGVFKCLRFGRPEITYIVLWGICSLFLEFGKSKFITLFYFPPIPETITTDFIAASVGLFAFAGGAILSAGLPLLALDRKISWASAVQSTCGHRKILFFLWFFLVALYEFTWFTAMDLFHGKPDMLQIFHADIIFASVTSTLDYLRAVIIILITSAVAERIYGPGIPVDK